MVPSLGCEGGSEGGGDGWELASKRDGNWKTGVGNQDKWHC